MHGGAHLDPSALANHAAPEISGSGSEPNFRCNVKDVHAGRGSRTSPRCMARFAFSSWDGSAAGSRRIVLLSEGFVSEGFANPPLGDRSAHRWDVDVGL